MAENPGRGRRSQRLRRQTHGDLGPMNTLVAAPVTVNIGLRKRDPKRLCSEMNFILIIH